MRTRQIIEVVQTHTEGQVTRHIVGGYPVIQGKTMEEKFQYAQEHFDWLRRLINHEPRGGNFMACTLLTEACDPRADFGVLHPQVGAWEAMCGHNTLGIATMLVELGMVKVTEPYTNIVLDTAAGLVYAKVLVENGVAKRASFKNAPAFVLQRDAVIHTKEWGDITFDLSFGGLIYAIVPADAVGLKVRLENASKLIEAGIKIRNYIEEQIEVYHPVQTFIRGAHHIELFSEPLNPEADVKNTVVCPLPDGGGFVDRSPCGTGTSAKGALLAAKGKLPVGASYVHESITGSMFTCTNAGETEVAGIPAIYPEVAGRAFVTGVSKYVVDPDDPFPVGFMLE